MAIQQGSRGLVGHGSTGLLQLIRTSRVVAALLFLPCKGYSDAHQPTKITQSYS
jgi:hypothetical protein